MPLSIAPRRISQAIGPLGVALIAVAVRLPSLGNGLVWLDHGDIEERAAVAAPGQWLELFARGLGRTGFYRPLVAWLLSVDALSGQIWVFHLTNLVLHALCSALVLVAARRLGFSRAGALAGALLFALHPATSIVVNAIAYRSESMATAALLGLVIAHLSRRPVWAAAALLAGALSKETALVLAPVWIALLGLLGLDREGPPRGLRSRPGLWAMEAAALVIAVGLRLSFAPAWNSRAPSLGALEAVGTRLAALGHAVPALAWPVDGRLCDAVFVSAPWSPWALLGLGLVAAVGWWATCSRKALLVAIACLPMLGLVPAPRLWSPHYLYIPLSLGVMWAGQALFDRGRLRWLGRRARWLLLVGLCLVLGGLSLREAMRFQDDLTLFASEFKGHPECREAAFYVGSALWRAGDLAGAASALEVAAAPAPGFVAYSDEAAALQNLGLLRLEQGNYFEAELALLQALERGVDETARRHLVHDLAAVAVARGDPAQAETLLAPEVARPDAAPESLVLLSRALRDMGREAEAKELLLRLYAPLP